MAIFRPKNINRRLVGSDKSPGNAGQIGPIRTPYLGGSTMSLGSRCKFGCCGGVFKANESLCGTKECCKETPVDCKGNLYCIASGCNWFIAASCSQTSGNNNGVTSNAVTCAVSELGSCGWAAASPSEMQSAIGCRQYWDEISSGRYMGTGNQNHPGSRQFVIPHTGGGGWAHKNQYGNAYGRAFRCVAI